MGRRKVAGSISTPDANRPFCYFCDRRFDDESILLQHQRGKHFRCQECDIDAIRGKCESVQGLIVHTLKVHNKSLAKVPNAMAGRENPELNVYGMDGIPPDFLEERGIKQHIPVGKAVPVNATPAVDAMLLGASQPFWCGLQNIGGGAAIPPPSCLFNGGSGTPLEAAREAVLDKTDQLLQPKRARLDASLDGEDESVEDVCVEEKRAAMPIYQVPR